MQELVGDFHGEGLAMRAGDQVQHHVHGRGAAAAAQALAVDAIQVAAHIDVGEFLREGAHRIPMDGAAVAIEQRSEEHTSELQSLMRISYAVFCLKKKNNRITDANTNKHASPHKI